MENEDKNGIDVPSDHFLNDLSNESNGIEEINYLSSVDSVEINLSQKSPGLEISLNGGSSKLIEGAKLDNIVEELAGNIAIKNEDEQLKDFWQHQEVLKGTSGNDKISLKDRSYTNDDITKKTEINASKGNDIYIGDTEIEKISYEALDEDKLIGLYISNSMNEMTIIPNNIAPLTLESYRQDDLLVHKEYATVEQNKEIDVLRDIDIIRASNEDDKAIIHGRGTGLA